MPIDLRLDADEAPLLTDFYLLTMAAAYFATGNNDAACFSMFTRRMPPRRGFLVAAGLEALAQRTGGECVAAEENGVEKALRAAQKRFARPVLTNARYDFGGAVTSVS